MTFSHSFVALSPVTRIMGLACKCDSSLPKVQLARSIKSKNYKFVILICGKIYIRPPFWEEECTLMYLASHNSITLVFILVDAKANLVYLLVKQFVSSWFCNFHRFFFSPFPSYFSSPHIYQSLIMNFWAWFLVDWCLTGFSCSYPRTESTAYPSSFDFRGALEVLRNNLVFGNDVQKLLADGYVKPRSGTDVGDHPPITPMRSASEDMLGYDAWRVYQYVCQHFLGTLSPDCKFIRWLHCWFHFLAGYANSNIK